VGIIVALGVIIEFFTFPCRRHKSEIFCLVRPPYPVFRQNPHSAQSCTPIVPDDSRTEWEDPVYVSQFSMGTTDKKP
jgi:hypothetical protein